MHPSQNESQERIRELARQAISRAAGAPLVPGNRLRILCDAGENYPAWLTAIQAARKHIHFESYIIHNDSVGRMFMEALAERAAAGVKVRLLYDWMGCFGTSRRLFRPLAQAGAQIRVFNPPRWDSPFGWISRDHRKMMAVDGMVGFVTGLCVSSKWAGDAERGIEPWRDTGVEVHGPAVADIERAFAEVWDTCGTPLPQVEVPDRETIAPAGDMNIRVIGTIPNTTGLYRLDQFIAAIAQHRLWLTDAYFVGVTPYVQALRSAARDGVDVRLLVPGGSDIPILRPISTAGYRPLLEAGVRVFEWNGPMLHAKTAVADGRWARVGSTNLNIASWTGNYELDVSVDDESFAQDMEEMYLRDLDRSTEIVLMTRYRVRKAPPQMTQAQRRRMRRGASAGRAAASALRITNTVGAAITNRRVLGRAEVKTTAAVALLLLLLSVVSILWPKALAFPLAFVGIWVAISLLAKVVQLKKK